METRIQVNVIQGRRKMLHLIYKLNTIVFQTMRKTDFVVNLCLPLGDAELEAPREEVIPLGARICFSYIYIRSGTSSMCLWQHDPEWTRVTL